MTKESQSKIDWTIPKHPIFEEIIDTRIRALIVVIIGCDVCPGGVKGIGLSHVDNKLKYINGKDIDTETERNSTDNVSLYDELTKWAVETSKAKKTESPQFNEDTITTFVNAIIYQPTN